MAARRDRMGAIRRQLAPTPAEAALRSVLHDLDAAIDALYVRVSSRSRSGPDLKADVDALDLRIELTPPRAQLAREAAPVGAGDPIWADLNKAASYLGEGGHSTTADAAKTAVESARKALAA